MLGWGGGEAGQGRVKRDEAGHGMGRQGQAQTAGDGADQTTRHGQQPRQQQQRRRLSSGDTAASRAEQNRVARDEAADPMIYNTLRKTFHPLPLAQPCRECGSGSAPGLRVPCRTPALPAMVVQSFFVYLPPGRSFLGKWRIVIFQYSCRLKHFVLC